MPQKPKSHSERQYESSPFKDFYEKQKLEAKKRYDSKRGNSSERGYSSKWQQARKGYLAKHPLCSDCDKQGIVKGATEVHHTIKAKDNKEIFWDSSLWLALCHSCHSRRTARGE